MNNFTFYSPTYFVFGKDEETNAGHYVRRFGGSKVLIHYGGGSIKRNGAYQGVVKSLEAAGIAAPAHCRSGECGWCHSRLVSGDVYIPEDVDGRRAADKKFGWIHPCCSYPVSDVTLAVPVIG